MTYFHCEDCNVNVSSVRITYDKNFICPFCKKSMRRLYEGESDE